MLVGGRQFRAGQRGAVVRAHDSLCQEKVAEKAGHQKVLAK